MITKDRPTNGSFQEWIYGNDGEILRACVLPLSR